MECVINASNSNILQALVQFMWKTLVIIYTITLVRTLCNYVLCSRRLHQLDEKSRQPSHERPPTGLKDSPALVPG
jgi:hypothetical protein